MDNASEFGSNRERSQFSVGFSVFAKTRRFVTLHGTSPIVVQRDHGYIEAMRISNSFSEGEIQVMDFIVQTLLRGGNPTMATRHKEFASLCRKVMAMKGKVQEKHAKARPDGALDASDGVADAAAETAASSVGTIRAPAFAAEQDNGRQTSGNNLATAV